MDFGTYQKGHIEQNETVENAALREVKEECGLSNRINIVDFFQHTYHVYLFGSDSVLKTTDWYIMKTSSKEKLNPQIEEGISECKWVPIDKLNQYLSQSFISIRELIYDFIKVNHLNR